MNKASLREKMSSLRDSLVQSDIITRNEHIKTNMLNWEYYKNASVVMSYVSFKNEADTIGIIEASLAVGKRVAVPVCKPGFRLLACEIKALDDLMPGTWGILEPVEPLNIISPMEIDFLIIPGLAFDFQLNRLGYGAGYYDRFLSQLSKSAIKTGLAYDMQLIENLPMDAHDVPMDYVITDKGILTKGTL